MHEQQHIHKLSILGDSKNNIIAVRFVAKNAVPTKRLCLPIKYSNKLIITEKRMTNIYTQDI